MNAWLRRVKACWRKIFFWQATEDDSRQFKPDAGHDHALVLSVTKKNHLPGWYQLRFFSRVLSKQEMSMFWICIGIFLFSIGLGSATLIRPHLVSLPARGGTITEALIGSPKFLNPLHAPQNDVDRDLVSLIYSGLFRIDENLNPQPDLADHYRWLEDGKTLEISLRKDARFHDGELITARDVIFTYHAVKDPLWRSSLASVFRDVNVLFIDDRTVQFQLPSKNPALLYDLTLGILPAHIWEDVESANAFLADVNLKPIGSGPYRVVSYTRDSRGSILTYHLRINSQYYGIKPHISDWVFRFYADRKLALQALQTNQVDALAFVPWGEATLVKNENIQEISLELPQETVVFFNVKDELLKNDSLRQALALAIDPSELEQVTSRHASVVTGPFPFLPASTSTTSTTPDLEASRQALSALRWILKDGDNIRTFQPVQKTTKKSTLKTTEPTTAVSSTTLHITIDVPSQPDLLKVADLLKRRWSLVGAQVDIRSEDAETLLRDAVDDRAYQIIIWNILLTPNQDLSTFWASDRATGRGLNLSNLADRDIELALSAVKHATTTEQILLTRQNLTEAIARRTPAIFLVRPAYAYLLSKHIRGASNLEISTPSDRLLQSADWYIKTRWSWK